MSTSFQQANLPVQITTPLGTDKLLVRSYTGEEGISELFHYRISLISEASPLSFSSIVGKNVTLQIPQSSGDIHYVNGVAARFAQSGADQRFVHYTLEIRPWLWLLTMTVDCQIFQNMSTPDIVKQVFNTLGFSDFKDSLAGTYQARDFCVQYRESSFAFVSRIMEEEGIFYFFEHTTTAHTMVLADDSSAWNTCTGLTSARYSQRPESYGEDDLILTCEWAQEVTPGQVTTDDFNFATPDTDLLATASSTDTSRSIYVYPGIYSKQSEGESIAALRLAAYELPGQTLQGSSHCRSFYAGAKFTLTEHYQSSYNTGYVIRKLRVEGDHQKYRNTFEAFLTTATFRPPMITPRPVIPGCQTAIVVGKSGEEIWTDQYGRIILKFNWDQSSAHDETSSCFIRVASPWAGKQWGSIHVPRIGQEVVVMFVEGNPNRPVVIGSVYNASQTVPYALPAQQTKSTLKSASSKGNGGNNELCFEDKAGSEEIYIQAQKDMTVSVLNDHSLTVAKDETRTVNGKRTLTVTGDEAHTNSGNYNSTVKGNFTLNVSGNLTIKAGGSLSLESGTSFTNKAGTALTNQAGSELTNKAGTELVNQAGTTLTNKGAVSQTIDGGETLTIKAGLVKIN